MKTDINGVPWTYENKDELVFDIEDESTYRGSTRLLDRLKEEKEYSLFIGFDSLILVSSFLENSKSASLSRESRTTESGSN